jgi:hypothetical protein
MTFRNWITFGAGATPMTFDEELNIGSENGNREDWDEAGLLQSLGVRNDSR